MRIAKALFGSLLGRRLPVHEGRLRVPCRAGVRIRRDEFGVAYVDAENEYDAWFGLGFCHGQDRAGQLEITLRLVRGTLSEVAGADALPVDRASRLIGVHHAARGQVPLFDADVRDQLTAFCDGVNAALGLRGAKRSHEHVLLRCEPSPWRPEDVVGLGLLMCCLLPSNWDVELARLLILNEDGPEAVQALDPSYRAELPLTLPPGAPAGESRPFVAQDLQALRDFLGAGGGSNAWAIGAPKTRDGRTLLANDPHLPATLPNLGYLTRVTCPAFRVAGISIVGIPGFITGHNERAAWGSTAAHVDNTDLFLEELGPGETVRDGSAFVPCSVREERILVRGATPVGLRVLSSPRGPIVARRADPAEGIFEPLPLPAQERANALSFAATWLGRRPTRALLSFHLTRSFEHFRELCRDATGCSYSMIYADADSVGWLLATEVPRRRSGFGSLPMPGWAAGWEPDVVRSSELPHAQNPASGFVCCANNQPVPDSEANVFLGHDFLDGYRQQRIAAELSRRDDWTTSAMAELQLDVLTLAWSEIRETVLALIPGEAPARRALELLRAWDGRLSADSAAASVYELFLAEVCERVARRKAPRAWQYAVGKGVMRLIPGTTWNARRASFTARLIRDRPPGYFDSWATELLGALAHAVTRLERDFGSDTSRWGWGRIRPLPLQHRLGEKPPLSAIFNPADVPGYGDGTTVNQAGFEYWKPLRHSTVTAHLRAVMEIGNWSAARFVLLGGQSGNPFSPNYVDQIPLWQAGRGIPIHCEEEAIRRASKRELFLDPAGHPGKP
ncbi:MAG TPA: penicillin acylase family protein [Polyangiaceae bacterium]